MTALRHDLEDRPHRFAGACGCFAPIQSRPLSRRAFLAATGALAHAALLPSTARAGVGHYDAMLLTCIDPRFPKLTLEHMNRRSMVGRYSQFNIAGAAIAAVAPRFGHWHQTFWDNLEASIQLHKIPAIIAMNHRDCGAAKIAFGDAAVTDRAAETATHREVLRAFKAQVAQRQPQLRVELGLMDLDGTVEILA